MPNLGSPFKCGHKFPNGLPMTDELHETLCDFYEYAKKQGCTDDRDVFFAKYFAKYEKLLRRAIAITYRNFV